MPASCRTATQPPSEPSRGQLAPPSASTAASGVTDTVPAGAAKLKAPRASQPVHRWRSANVTLSRSSRPSQARSSGEALSAVGNTRPLEPMKVDWPRPSHQARSASGGNAAIAARSRGSALP